MIKKFNKKKGSRQGAILVTVVFILAFAIIFIAAAMMLTQHTRKRVYEEAESNQARLTVTSVAEAFYRAIQKCEFADADIIDLSTGSGTTIKVQASSYAETIPGLEDYGVTNPDSYTTCKIYRVHKSGAGTTDDDYTYYADFSTHIDGKVENVRAELSYVTPHTDTDGAPFSTQFDLNTDFDNVNLENVGEGKDGDLDNIFLVRKNSNQASSSYSSTATMVYCDGKVSFKEEILNSRDIVFLQGAKLAVGSGDMCKWSTSSKVKNLFFFGSGSESISDDTSRGNFGDVAKNMNFYLCGRTDNTAWTSGNNVIEINTNGKKTNGQPVFTDEQAQTDFENKVKVYASYNTQYKKGGTNPYPTTDTFLRSSKQMNHNAVSSKTAPSNPTWSGNLGSFLTNKCFQKLGGYLPSGTYVIDGDESDHTDNHPSLKCAKFPYVIVLQGGSNYQFWFKGNQDYTLKNVIFIVNDPKPAHPVLFLLEDKANIYWPGGSDGMVCGNGILAVEGRTFASAQKTFDFIDEAIFEKTKPDGGKEVKAKYATPKNFENDSGKYSTRYNSTNEVCAMVIGMGHNHFELDKNVLMESYVGLFNDSYEKSNQSMIRIRNNDSGAYYCRFMTDGYNDKDAGKWDMPATPSSTALPNPNPPIKKLVTGFSLNSMKYYYGINPVTGT